MTEQELATLWCALNCATGSHGEEMALEAMRAIERRIGDKEVIKRWNELSSDLNTVKDAVKRIT